MVLAFKERPGVEITQEFQTQSPVILTPALQACILGPAKQVVEAVLDDGSLNSRAQLALPAQIPFSWVSTPFEYTGFGGNDLGIRINNGPERIITFGGSGARSVDMLADDIRTANYAGLTVVVEVSGAQKRLVLRTTATGEFAQLEIGSSTDSALLSPGGIRIGQASVGRLGYSNYHNLLVGVPNFPNPRNNINELVIDYDTVRAFVANGAGSFREPLRTEALLNGAVSAVTVINDGDGDNLSPYLAFAGGVTFKNGAAVMTGSIDLTSLTYGVAGDFDPALDFVFTLDGGSPVTVSLGTGIANAAAIATAINTAVGSTVAEIVSQQLVITSPTSGYLSRIEISSAVTSPAASVIGMTPGAVALGTPSIALVQGITDLTAVTHATQIHGRALRMSIDGDDFQTLVFPNTTATPANIVTAIDALWGSSVARLSAGNRLEISSRKTYGGLESMIRIDSEASDSVLTDALGLTGGSSPFETLDYVRGRAFPVAVGDEVWVDGRRVGAVTEVPVSFTNRLRLDVEKALTFTGSAWYIRATGLDNDLATVSRPTSELYVDAAGNLTIQHTLFHDIGGRPVLAGPLATYVGYTALRLDVTAAARNASLQRSSSTTDIEERFAPIDTQNPFGLALYLCKLGAGQSEVTGIGVDDVSNTEPDGTFAAYARAFEFLESKRVYAIAPLTHDLFVFQLGQIHVNEMSKPENGQVRVLIGNPSRPTRRSDTLVASGPTANVSGAPTNEITTGVADLPLLLAAAGLPGPTYTEDDELYIELEDDTNKYLIASVNGGVITVNNGPLVDSLSPFYDAAGGDVFPDAIIDRPFSVKVLGAPVANLTEEAEAYSDIGRIFADRRVIMTAPDQAVTTIDGLDTVVDGYFMNAVLAGVISNKKASLPLTESILPFFKGVVGSNDRYGEQHLKALCGGGLWVFYQNGESVLTRHQLTTDGSSIEKQEFSITNALDYGDSVMRLAIQLFIGRVNLSQTVEDSVNTVINGVCAFLVRELIFKSMEVVSIKEIPGRPDGLEIECDVGVYYPLNKIRVRFVV